MAEMTREEILSKLHSVAPLLLEEYGISHLALFGSYAKNKQTENSDIDILIGKMRRKNGLTIARAQRFLSEYLDKPVDLGLYDSLRPFIKSKIQDEITYV
jgi:predicted nucleotidyltransferase